MARRRNTPLTTWGPIILACAFGCATGTQGEGPLGGQGGTGDIAGSSGTGGGSGTAGTETAGSSATAGASAGSSSTSGTNAGGSTTTAGTASGGTFSTAGTGTFGGTFSTSGTTGMAGGGSPTGGTGGKGGSGGTAGASAGAAGKGGTAGTAGTSGSGGSGGGGGGKCKSVALTPTPNGATSSGTPEYPASKAVDGDVTTRWSSEHMIDDEWLQVDFGQPVVINHVNIVWEAAYATNYKLQVSNAAAGPFTDLYENTNGMGATEDIVSPALTAGAGRYLRMQGIARKLTMYGYSVFEIKAYGDTDATCK